MLIINILVSNAEIVSKAKEPGARFSNWKSLQGGECINLSEIKKHPDGSVNTSENTTIVTNLDGRVIVAKSEFNINPESDSERKEREKNSDDSPQRAPGEFPKGFLLNFKRYTSRGPISDGQALEILKGARDHSLSAWSS